MAMYLLAETGWKHPEMMCVSSIEYYVAPTKYQPVAPTKYQPVAPT